MAVRFVHLTGARELLAAAVDIVRRSDKASASLLQRRLIGEVIGGSHRRGEKHRDQECLHGSAGGLAGCSAAGSAATFLRDRRRPAAGGTAGGPPAIRVRRRPQMR